MTPFLERLLPLLIAIASYGIFSEQAKAAFLALLASFNGDSVAMFAAVSEVTQADLDAMEAEGGKCCAAPDANPEVGKLFPGDGSFLKMLIELFLKFAPIFIK